MSMIFLMCSERSGSNLIIKLLDAHSSICGPSTKHLINPVVRNLFRYEPLSAPHNWNALLVDIHRLMNVGFSVWKKSYCLDELGKLAPAGDIASLIRNIFYEEALANGKQHVFIKENHVYEFLPFLLINYPESRYVYQTRDPRDMALSWKNSPDHRGGVVRAATQWKKDQQNSLKNFNELKKLNKACLVKYENLISEPERYTDELVSFFGLASEICHMNFHKQNLTQQNAAMHGGWRNLSREVISDNKGKYVKELPEYEVKIIEKICYFEMKCLGYEPGFSMHELDLISGDEIHELDAFEMRTIPYHRSEGVKANMEAKKVFYQRVI
jgi:Sulfotransferase family